MQKPLTLALVLIGVTLVVRAEERVDLETYWKIRREGMSGSQILHTLHRLTDLYGPRLTGSPNLKAAAEWAVGQMEAWGLKNGRLEPWDFGHVGWLNERLAAHLVRPVKDALVAEALAWTPGTNGVVRAEAVQIDLPDRPTEAGLAAHLERLADDVRGRIVLVGSHQTVPVTFNPAPRRRDERDVRAQYDPDNPAPPAPGPPAGPPAAGPPASPSGPRPLTPNQLDERVNAFLLANGAVLRVNDAGRDHGQIRAFGNRTFDPAKAPPTVVLRNEDYGRISRLLANGAGPVELEFEIVNRIYPEGRTQYNAIAEIPGTDKADEVVMLGGHLDSWHAATGATDNAIGCAVVMEAVRILQAVGVRPRRTIRIALWSGEEQGLLGSQAYVKEHFGSAEDPKPAFSRFGGYFNIDSGTGRVRGATVFGPPEAAAVLRAALLPFEDLGVAGATQTRSRRRGGSDHTSFNEAGLPGIGMGQDPIEYGTYTWHTNLDTYERIVEADVKSSAIVIAAAVYHLATRDDLLPRFGKEDLPPPVRPEPPTRPSP